MSVQTIGHNDPDQPGDSVSWILGPSAEDTERIFHPGRRERRDHHRKIFQGQSEIIKKNQDQEEPETTLDKIIRAQVLLVGAGGIGCELLKNLVLTGFEHISVIDLDTIDLSNLNRQFLFRNEHIKKPKAEVAAEVAKKFHPKAKIYPEVGNIKDAKYDVKWFREYSLVFNALDNLDARRWVNRMCLAAKVPLIESGTTGFNGQVQVIVNQLSECYDCTEKAIPKSFPICPIRSTPSQPIHCIVWARSYLFQEIFGTSEDEAPEVDQSKDAENAAEIDTLQQEARALKDIRDSMDSPKFAAKIVQKVFIDDVNRLRSMDGMWKGKKLPQPLDLDELLRDSTTVDESVATQDQRVWTVKETFEVFQQSLDRLRKRYRALKPAAENAASAANGTSLSPVLAFDKDDDDTLDFVAAAANLRSYIFHIDPKSKFDVKQMAGNIIPAIATTNAIVAGLCVTEALKLLAATDEPYTYVCSCAGETDFVPEATLHRKSRNIFLCPTMPTAALSVERTRAPNPECAVCSVSYIPLSANLKEATINDLIEEILKKKLGYKEEFTILNRKGPIYEPDFEDNSDRLIADFLEGDDGTGLRVVDENDVDGEGNQPFVDVALLFDTNVHSDEAKIHLHSEDRIEIPRRKPKAVPAPVAEGAAIEKVQEVQPARKRKRDAEDEGRPYDLSVRSKMTNGHDVHMNGVSKDLAVDVEKMEDESGVIELD